VLVNGATPYVAPANTDNLVSMDTALAHSVPRQYQLAAPDQRMDDTALKALDKMLSDFAKLHKLNTVVVDAAYVSPEELGERPADHLTGLGCLLKYAAQEEDTVVYHGLSEAEVYGWLADNCYKYGFVVRYPADKAEATGVSGYTDYFRYVGTPHAEYMTENDLCLEEYIELLKGYDFTQPLSTYAEGVHYEIFYAAVTETGMIQYPAFRAYTYSGIGKDGLIVIMTD
jgi:D-alanyl-D-alanine carboxypeptidase